jgi:hypothetical protein
MSDSEKAQASDSALSIFKLARGTTMTNIDLSIINQEPSYNASLTFAIEPTSAVSMGAGQKGVLIASHPLPPISMICGLLENIMGWHFNMPIREQIIENNPELFSKSSFKSGFLSIIHPFIQIFLLNGENIKNFHYLDYNKMFTNKAGRNSFLTPNTLNNASNYDESLHRDLENHGFSFSDVVTLFSKYAPPTKKKPKEGNREIEKFIEKYAGKLSSGNGKQKANTDDFFKDLEALLPEVTARLKNSGAYSFESDPNDFYKSISDLFPQYLGRPVFREFIVPFFKDTNEPARYEFMIHSSPELIAKISEAIQNPQGFPYLGTSESCVELSLLEG